VWLFHTHGKADQTVPLTGREIMPSFVQGNVFEAMEIWRTTNGCASAEADETATKGIYSVQHWTKCQPGTDLRFALHEGGHSIPEGWAKMAVDWFEMR
jgi:polyhydroxybutyrate depolymerase